MPTGMDFAADKNCVEFARVARLYELPDFVKKANLETTQQPRNVAVTVYADPVRQQFPCHSKAATWINTLFYQEKKAEFHSKDQALIEARLEHYARYWGIKDAVDQIKLRHAELHKTAESQRPDSDYAYVWTAENGTKDRRLPLTTATQVKDAAEWLETYRDRIPFADRNVIATKILEKAARYGAALGDQLEFLEKQAGRGVCSPREVVTMLQNRALLAKAATHREMLTKLAAAVQDTPQQTLHPDRLVKLAETVDMSDRVMGLAGLYTDTIPRPEDVIFGATFTKTAAACQSVVATVTGKVYERNALKKLAVDDLRDLFGDEFVSRIRTGLELDPEKMASEFVALPRPEQELVEGLLADRGVRPVLTKAANARQGLSEAQLQSLADQYV